MEPRVEGNQRVFVDLLSLVAWGTICRWQEIYSVMWMRAWLVSSMNDERWVDIKWFFISSGSQPEDIFLPVDIWLLSGDIFGCRYWCGGYLLLASSEPGMLQDILQCLGQHPP